MGLHNYVYTKQLSAKNLKDLVNTINDHDAAIFESIFKIRWLQDYFPATIEYWTKELINRPLAIFAKLPIPKSGSIDKRLGNAFLFLNPTKFNYQSYLQRYIKDEYKVNLTDISSKIEISLKDYYNVVEIYKKFIKSETDYNTAEAIIRKYIRTIILH